MRRPLIALIFVYSIATFGLTLIPGQDPEGNVWFMSFFHAFYFVSFMGSTIGFGEIPYPFTDEQRYWVLGCIYVSVIAWLYTIGTLLSLIQDAGFKQAVTVQRFSHAISKLNSPFFIICGYGDTGKTLTKELSAMGYSVVVLDNDPDSLIYLPLDDFSTPVNSLVCDVSIPENLVNAGLMNPHCQAIVALTDHDHTNLKVAVTAKSMQPSLLTVCRAQEESEIANLKSFHTDVICNPNEIFANRLVGNIKKPAIESITNYVISQNNDSNDGNANHEDFQAPQSGKWIICGYGLFGRTVKAHLDAAKIPNIIVVEKASNETLPDDVIQGTGTEAHTLESAGIHQATGLIAGTQDDANNLSILLTAKNLNPAIYTIGRLNQKHNRSLYNGAEPNTVFRDHQVMADSILTRLTRPMVTHFLKQIDKLSENQAEDLQNRIQQLDMDSQLITWRMNLTEHKSPAIKTALASGQVITIADLQKNLHGSSATSSMDMADMESQTIDSLCLLIKRSGHYEVAPSPSSVLQQNDQLLFCGTKKTASALKRISHDIELFDNQLNPSLHSTPLLRWFSRKAAIKSES